MTSTVPALRSNSKFTQLQGGYLRVVGGQRQVVDDLIRSRSEQFIAFIAQQRTGKPAAALFATAAEAIVLEQADGAAVGTTRG